MKVLLYIACLATTAFGLTDDERTATVEFHNEKKRLIAAGQQAALNGVLPAAANMYEYGYDATVEASAQAWANNCTFEHNGYAGGQNLYAVSASDGNYTELLQNSVNSWYSEIANFNISNVNDFEVDPNLVTGHFTQVIWATSYLVGCGITQCATFTNMDGYDNGYIVVCNYQTQGNIISEPVYLTGDACSQCPSDRYCVDSLCAINPNATTTEATSTTTTTTTTAAPQTEMYDSDRTFVVDYHNDYRRTVALGEQAGSNGNLPSAANMLELVYDTDIEADAQAWANNCSFGYSSYAGGQNMILYETSSSSSQNYTVLLKAAVDEFVSQASSFNTSYVADYSSDAGSLFSQVIWANTSSLGCGVQACPNYDSTGFYAYMVVCFYQGAGDIAGQPIYTQGDSCSQCPSGTTCDNGLCATS
ncbi:unnamed protein product [Bursaphelenchus okinawaensis]|uniref:SCP domain-containing protein n=1 Tax=Bursaphelenchus okinawaensis TaxID=465554 RepID=A0A811LKG6_9BILA|nr:unnamed protein product [Bursaphelenchus okinawaensis]CAG9123903.1 unnamed protein product [Bursaphelenchus okinawaensis]